MACPGCVRRLKVALVEKGWIKEDEWWAAPDGRKKIHQNLVECCPTTVIAAYPELIPAAAKALVADVVDLFR